MKPNSTMTRSSRTSAVAAATFCCLFGLLFTKTAKADCGLSAIPRAIANFADSAAGSGVTPQIEGSSNHPHIWSQQTPSTSAETPKAAAEDNPEGGSIVGLWLTTFTSGGMIVDQGFDIWSSDGTEILNDTPPPATGNVCLGTYIKTGSNTFRLKHPSWTFDNNGNLNGTAIIRETVTVQPSQKTFKGTYTLDFFALSGANIGHYTGTLAGTRITVD